MTILSIPNSDGRPVEIQHRRALTGILEYAISSLELTAKQRASVDATYKECGAHLSTALGLAQEVGDIFPQGSMRLGTVIRPLRDITEVFDLDVVFRIALLCTGHHPDRLRDLVGHHLRKKYNGAVKPLAKGWRLDFSQERDYHLDIIPAMDSALGGNTIAITDVERWRDSNPRDYAGWFERQTAMLPRFEADVSNFNEGRMLANSARIEPLPEHTEFKAPLQRIVQIAKRHRDYYFNKKAKQPTLVTASIVVTTLLTKAYTHCVETQTFRSGFDLLLACVADMPNYVNVGSNNGAAVLVLENPSLPSENLIEKWKDRRYAKAFYEWQRDFATFLQQLLIESAPHRHLLSEALGEAPVNSAFAKQAETFNAAREHRLLTVVPTIGLALGSGAPIPRHVIHGTE